MANGKQIIRDFLKSDERVLVMPFDGVRADVAKHWHDFLRQSLWSILKKWMVLGITKNMFACRLKNALLRRIGVQIGNNVFIAATVALDPQFPELIRIEDGAILGMHSHIFTHEVTHRHIRLGKVTIGKNALVGALATIRSGVSVGENGVVAMNAFVTEDVAPQTLVTGERERAIKNLSKIL